MSNDRFPCINCNAETSGTRAAGKMSDNVIKCNGTGNMNSVKYDFIVHSLLGIVVFTVYV